MPVVGLDTDTDGPKGGKDRRAFEDTLTGKGRKAGIRVGGTLGALPDTTRVAHRTAAEAELDLPVAAAMRIGPPFAGRSTFISRYDRVDGGSDDVRPGGAIRGLIDRARR